MSEKKNRDRETLLDIHSAGRDVVKFTDAINFDYFKANKMAQNATLYSIQIIGEVTKKLSPQFKEVNSQIPWRDMAGMRDKIVHDYNGINLDLIWDVAKNDVPKLLQQINELIPKKT